MVNIAATCDKLQEPRSLGTVEGPVIALAGWLSLGTTIVTVFFQHLADSLVVGTCGIIVAEVFFA